MIIALLIPKRITYLKSKTNSESAGDGSMSPKIWCRSVHSHLRTTVWFETPNRNFQFISCTLPAQAAPPAPPKVYQRLSPRLNLKN